MPRYRRYKTFEEFERDLNTIPRPSYSATALKEQEGGLERIKKAPPELRLGVKDRENFGPQASSRLAALAALSRYEDMDADEFGSLSRAEKSEYQTLRNASQEEEEPTPPGADRRRYNPTGNDFAVTSFGNIARYAVVPRLLGIRSRAFAFARATVPCIQRHTRREVMFATGRAGKGYRTPHRRNPNSDVEC